VQHERDAPGAPRSGVIGERWRSRRRMFPIVPDERSIEAVLASDEPFDCQECHWQGRRLDLVRIDNDDGSTELLCPSCEQAHWIFPP
jgi:hypothetical protein